MISEPGSFSGKMKRCNLMQITVPLPKGLKLEEICQNIVKVEESNFITLRVCKDVPGQECLRAFVEWAGSEEQPPRKGRLVGPGRPLPGASSPSPARATLGPAASG